MNAGDVSRVNEVSCVVQRGEGEREGREGREGREAGRQGRQGGTADRVSRRSVAASYPAVTAAADRRGISEYRVLTVIRQLRATYFRPGGTAFFR